MKKILLICFVLICSVQGKVFGQKKSRMVADTVVRSRLEGTKTIKFSIHDAAFEIEALMGQKVLKDLAKKCALGGMFQVDEFFPDSLRQSLTDGVLMWFCFNPNRTGGRPDFFLAIEPGNANMLPSAPQKDILTYPVETFVFKDRDLTGTYVDYVRGHTVVPSQPRSFPIDNGSVRNHMATFRKHLDDHHAPGGIPYNKALGSFFQNNPDSTDENNQRGLLTRLVSQPGAYYIRYYFAYDSSSNNPNRIRILLIAANERGENITQIQASGRTADALVLQKSIPPPPDPD